MTTNVGQRKRATLTLEVGDVLTNGTVTVQVLAPDGTVSSPSVTNSSTGVYVADFTVTEPGRWTVRAFSSGAVIAAAETSVDVAASPFYPAN